jgi:hypothetical protein
MSEDVKRVTLKRNGQVFVDGCRTDWGWCKTTGFQKEYKLTASEIAITHYTLKTFKLKVLNLHNGCGEFG